MQFPLWRGSKSCAGVGLTDELSLAVRQRLSRWRRSWRNCPAVEERIRIQNKIRLPSSFPAHGEQVSGWASSIPIGLVKKSSIFAGPEPPPVSIVKARRAYKVRNLARCPFHMSSMQYTKYCGALTPCREHFIFQQNLKYFLKSPYLFDSYPME